MRLKITPTTEDVVIARFAALAIGIHVLEGVLPSPFPGIKPGFANIVTMLVFMIYGVGAASWVSILRVVVGSLIVGTFLSPTFALSFSGAVASLVLLYICDRYNKKFIDAKLGIFSIGILMSMSHMAAQFAIVYVFFIPHKALLSIFPFMMTAALIFGVVNSVIAFKVHEKIKNNNDSSSIV